MFDLESNMRKISERSYDRLSASSWWGSVAKRLPSGSKRERISWLLDTARIRRPNAQHGGGQAVFDDIVSQTTEFEALNAVAGLQIKKEQLEDLDGNGENIATEWSRQAGAYSAYWPQREVASAIKANPTAYDGRPLFDAAHPANPFDLSAGTYSNDLGASYSIAGADEKVALANLAAARAQIAKIPMPNGVDPRMLRISAILVPPALESRAIALTDAKFLAAAGQGTGDVEGIIRNLALGTPIVAPELDAAFGGSDTAYYLLVEEITNDELGALVYVEREPFTINYHGPMTDAELARKREFQWTTEGRNVVAPGHPYLIFRCGI